MILKFNDNDKTILDVESGYFFEKISSTILKIYYHYKNTERFKCLLYQDEKIMKNDMLNNQEIGFKMVTE